MSDYDAADDSRRSYDLGIAALREICIRKGQVAPSEDPELRERELRWAAEGPVSNNQLETVRHG